LSRRLDKLGVHAAAPRSARSKTEVAPRVSRDAHFDKLPRLATSASLKAWNVASSETAT